jgi:hypothetical protein
MLLLSNEGNENPDVDKLETPDKPGNLLVNLRGKNSSQSYNDCPHR